MNVHQSLREFIDKFISQTSIEQRTVDFDSTWQSPCIEKLERTTPFEDGENVTWRPCRQVPVQQFGNVERALEMQIHQDIKTYYTSFWSGNLPAVAKQGHCELLQVWNEEDFSILQENLIGHVLMKRRLRQATTLFIGLTDEEDFILSVNNESGEVMLEQVGQEPAMVLAKNLAEFIDHLDVESNV